MDSALIYSSRVGASRTTHAARRGGHSGQAMRFLPYTHVTHCRTYNLAYIKDHVSGKLRGTAPQGSPCRFPTALSASALYSGKYVGPRSYLPWSQQSPLHHPTGMRPTECLTLKSTLFLEPSNRNTANRTAAGRSYKLLYKLLHDHILFNVSTLYNTDILKLFCTGSSCTRIWTI